MSLLNLDRFDGYPDSGDKKKRPLTVLEMWQELGYDPTEDDGNREQRAMNNEQYKFVGAGPNHPPEIPFT